MKITLENIGKRYNDHWIFKNINLTIESNSAYAILGSNGSGKSTLLKVIAGYVSPSEGAIGYSVQNEKVSSDDIFRHVSLAAPYMSLVDQFTLEETIHYHFKFKKSVNGVKAEEVIELLDLSKARGKRLKQFSTGMLQRLKQGLAVLTESTILLLDEPIANLDKKGAEWFSKILDDHKEKRTIFVCSNHREGEYEMCENLIEIEDYK
ncbi:MAG: ABC transporter ATP-binding protein [Bacteroidetes bacterium]|nr:MAG: ABC transporter ATP-binding protein [Bacteroidota bacterium]